MAKTETVTKNDFISQINEKWKKEQQCYDEAKVEGKDTRTGKKTTISWPRDKPVEQSMWESWLQKITDPDTGKFYEQRDKNGNTIKGTGPKYLVKTIVRIRTNDGSEFLYSKGRLTGFDVIGDVVSQKCNEPETWAKVGFAYDKQFNQNTMSMKQKLVGPNSRVTIYDMSFNEKNLKTLFEKRIDDNIYNHQLEGLDNDVTITVELIDDDPDGTEGMRAFPDVFESFKDDSPEEKENTNPSLEPSGRQSPQPVVFIKCPHCKFENIHQEVIDHHVRLTHDENPK